MSDLHYISATEALRRFRSRELSPVELMQATIDRALGVELTVNALSQTFFDEALVQAREAEARYSGKGEPPRALEGIPLAVKDEEAITGHGWSQGSLIYRDAIADHTSTFAGRAIDAGAIVHARTTTPEFCCAGFTHSKIWGVTRNPWNPEYAVGGSSGGSGAALASGSTVLASGSDIGGSIRIPASFNGVVGFKPPYGRVPQEPPFNLDTYCHCGPMARTVADCALYENVIAGPDPLDIVSLRPKLVLPDELEDIRGMRIALSLDLGDWPVEGEIASNTLAVAAALRAAGAVVDQVDLALPRDEVLRAAGIHFQLGFGAWIAHEAESHPDAITAYAAEFPRQAARWANGGTQIEKLELEAKLYAPLGALLERYDALICPTVGTRGLIAGDDYVGKTLQVDGYELEGYMEALLTPPFNVLSRCPVLAVPSGTASNGVPTGVQIVGRTYDDETVFRVGAALEREQPWLDVPERRPAERIAATAG